jgi:UDP-N-acetylglucosamine:LPS N-acetylglucosamine transferase
MTYLQEQGIITCKTYGIITDFTVHPFWESTGIDYYVTPDALLNQQMSKKGITEEKILPYGIPIKEKFYTKTEQKKAREMLGISDKTTVLVMMGSMGFGNMEKNLRALDALGKETVMRCILIPEINLNQDHAKALADIFESLNHCRHIELLAYHPYGLSKSEQLGRCDVRYTQPEQAELEKFAEDLKARNIPVKLYGSML